MDLALLTCPCGQQFPGQDPAVLFSLIKAHSTEAHPELGLTDNNIRDFIAALFRLSPVRPRVETLPPITVKALSPALLDDYLHFFDYDGFAGNPAWAGCYCAFHLGHWTEAEWGHRTAAQNRALITERILAGEAQGYLAYAGEAVAGWCHAAPRTLLPGLYPAIDLGDVDPATTGVTPCFLIAPPYRRHGLAERMLDAALEGFAAQELAQAEGFPRKGEDPSDGGRYYGPRRLYESRGYAEVGEGTHRWVMRKTL